MKKLVFLLPCLLLAGCGFQSECQDAVKYSLKAPSTAVFSKIESYKTDIYGEVVGGFVESQNGFGAMVWDKFYCVKPGADTLVVFKELDKELYDSITQSIQNKSSNDDGRAECEGAMQKIMGDNRIKFVQYMPDDGDDDFKVNGGMIYQNEEFKNVFCMVDSEKGGLYQVKIDDKTYSVSRQ